MIKLMAGLILAFFLFSNISAILINEVEMNPSEGKEWVELYNNNEEIDISNWKMYDGLPQKIFTIPNGTLIGKGDYYLIRLNKSYLNNDENGDLITLENSEGEKIDDTPILKDTIKNSKTHQFCSSEWIFAEQTKEAENNCDEELIDNDEAEEEPAIASSPETEEAEQSTEEDEETHPATARVQQQSSSKNDEIAEKPITADVIELNPSDAKDIKTNSNILNSDSIAIYGLFGFCILLGTLFAISKIKKPKTEFEQ